MFLPLILLFSSTLQREPTFSHLRMPLHGTLYRDKLYGLFEVKDPIAFRLQSVDLKKSGLEAQSRYGLLLHGSGRYHRYRIGFNRLWLSEGLPGIKSMSFEDLALFDYRVDPKGWDAYLEKYEAPKSKGEPGMIGLPALEKKPFSAGGLSLPVEGLTGLATVPTSESTFKTFLLLRGKTGMEVWDTKAKFDAETKRWKEVSDLKNLETIESPFSEDFYVFIQKDAYYFVTESGKAYAAPPPKKGEKTRTMKSLWRGDNFPIVAVIEDADNDKVWLFTKARKKFQPDGVFFEMAAELDKQKFDHSKLKPVNVEGRARPLLEYLPLIRADKKQEGK